MKIANAELEVIATRRSQYPDANQPEFLLVGRSNVGKSSFINTILERKNIAYTSSKPGKTQTLNFYHVNQEFYLIDVPGYGYYGGTIRMTPPMGANERNERNAGKGIDEGQRSLGRSGYSGRVPPFLRLPHYAPDGIGGVYVQAHA